MLDRVQALAAQHHLVILGGFNCGDEPDLPAGTQSLILLGPAEPGYWSHIKTTPEFIDGGVDPIDRWSQRVIGTLADEVGATALFPFGGAPYHPFFSWALRTGRIWQSPVRLLVHDQYGLMVSFRGALALPTSISLPPTANVCDTCPAPCLTACPAEALTAQGYDVPRCHQFLDTTGGTDCMNSGCAVRRACPLPLGRARLAEHSAYHMGIFHK